MTMKYEIYNGRNPSVKNICEKELLQKLEGLSPIKKGVRTSKYGQLIYTRSNVSSKGPTSEFSEWP